MQITRAVGLETPPSLLSWLTETVERFIHCPINTRGFKITEENVLPLLCHLQVAKLSLIRTKNLRPRLTAFWLVRLCWNV